MSMDDEIRLTEAVVARAATAPDPRFREISEKLIRHLHAFVRDVRPSQAEWQAAIGFLTRVGQMCDERRQEFILLSDALGVSMLVDLIDHDQQGGATESTVLGPFYVRNPPEFALGADLSPGLAGTPLLVSGTVASETGQPIANALIDVWHCDKDGLYDVQRDGALISRGRFRSDAEGRFHFRTITPSCYPIPDDGPVGDLLAAQGRHPWRPAHVHFLIAAPGYRDLITHLFVAGDDYLGSDVVFGVKSSLICPLVRSADDPAALDLRYAFQLAAAMDNG